ncbi:MAG: hypothetical protein H7Z42_18185 [Roseiflexaceae bacterium]|nr:hypothetical protein [Roseiflexaceae bacterium]
MLVYQPTGTIRRYPALERLICAAVSNASTAAQLLADPRAVLTCAIGHDLSIEERAAVLRVRDARNIQEFAAMLHAALYATETEVYSRAPSYSRNHS